MILRREGEPDETAYMSGMGLLVGQPFTREGVDWVIVKDDGPSQVDGCVVRFICEPA